MNEERRPNPDRPDTPLYTPVVFDEERDAPRGRRLPEDLDLTGLDDLDDAPRGGDRRRPGGGRGGDGDGRPPRRVRGPGEGDSGLLKILGVVVLLGLVIVAIVLPGSPFRLIGRTSSASAGEGVSAKALDKVPAVPNGFEALSKLYEINVPEGAKGPWTIEVALTKPTTDGTNLGFYSYDSGRWTRIATVAPVKDGKSAAGDVGSAPGSIAVLRRSGVARQLGLIIDAGQIPDARGVAGANVIAVMAATPAAAGDAGGLTVTAGVIGNVAKAAGAAKVYLGVSPGNDAQAAIRAIGSSPAHVDAIATLAKRENASGVFLDYETVPAGQRDAFTAFVKSLRDRLQREQLGLIVGVPAAAGANGGAYDWPALTGSADALWLRSTPDAATYYEQMETLLGARRDAGADLSKVTLIVDRRSQERVGTTQKLITLRDALTAASTIDRSVEATAAAGATVTLKAQNLGDTSPVLKWDNTARTVTFSYSAPDGQHSLWLENRFSAAFRLDLASRFNLGGVAVAQAQQDDALPDVWAPVTAFVQDGTVQLTRPFGPYLAPCWQTAGGSVEGAACWSADTVPAQRAWRAPAEPGVYDVKLVVSDGTAFVAQQIALRVGGASATPTATPATGVGTATPAATPRPAATPTPTPARTPAPAPTLPPPPTGGTAAPTPVRTPTPAPTAAPTQAATPAPTSVATLPPGQPPGPAGQ